MLTRVIFLAAAAPPPGDMDPLEMVKASRPASSFGSTEMWIVLAAVAILAAALFSWAYFIRRRPGEQHGSMVLNRVRRSRHGEEEGHSERRVRIRRRRRHHSGEQMPRNPTLAETGGLPPPKPEEEPPAEPDSPPA